MLENLGVNAGYGTRALMPVRGRAERRIYNEIFDNLGIKLDFDQKVGNLTPAERALLAVARAMRVIRGGEARQLFVLDEPTTYLPRPEANRVTALMRSVAQLGIGVLFVSHRMKEVMATTDTFTVLRDGKVVADGTTAHTSERQIIRAMLGRDLAGSYPSKVAPPVQQDPVLVVQDLAGPRVQQATFRAYAGEVLGITGLSGMGQDELAYIIAGALPRSAGRLWVNGTEIAARSPREVIERDAVLIPSDRQRDGGWLAGTAGERQPAGARRLLPPWPATLASRARPLPRPDGPLCHPAPGPRESPTELQWRESAEDSLVQMASVAAKTGTHGRANTRCRRRGPAQILGTVTDLAREGSCVVIFSGDHEQLAAICHRVLVMSQGTICAELADDQVTEDGLLAASQLGAPAGTASRGA